MSIIRLHFDGSCWPNPGGTAGYGYVINVDGVDVAKVSDVIGTGPEYSNNYAEFYALYKALEYVAQIAKPRDYVNVIGDSQLVIMILKKRFKVKKGGLYYPAFELAYKVLQQLRGNGVAVVFNLVSRNDNTVADALSKAKYFN